MFTELLPLLKDRTLMLIVAGLSDHTLRVNVIPQRKSSKENDAAENAFTSPLTITGTAEELDREFAQQIAGYRASFDRLKSNLGAIESAHAEAIKTIEEERKKELNSKRKASNTTVKAAARLDSEPAPAPANGKPVFGSKATAAASPTTQSLFDASPAATAEQPPDSQPENRSEPKADALAAPTESTVSSPPTSDKPNNDTPAECGICHRPILPNQQRHSLMPFPAHASASDCEAARKCVATTAN
ncbi:MAG: PRTRC system protein E [Bryobacteraceae bacterium]